MNKILIVASKIPNDYSGAGKAAIRLSTNLKNDNRLFSIITSTKRSNIRNMELPVKSIAFEKFKVKGYIGKLLKIFISFFTITKYIYNNRNEFNILHCFSPSWDSLICVLVSKLLGKKIIIELTLLGSDNPGFVADNDFFKILYQRRNIQYKFADKIVCLSKALYDDCSKNGYEEKSVIIERSVDVSIFKPINKKEKDNLKKELGITNSKNILFVGSLLYRKGAHELIPILNEVNKVEDVDLIIVGNGAVNREEVECTKVVKDQINQFNIANRIHLIGKSGRVQDYMSVADLFLFPSKKEGMPNVLLEAMSSGLPVVVNQIHGITNYMIDHLVDGFICNNCNVKQYSKVIHLLLTNTELANKFSVMSRKKIVNEYSVNVIMKKYHELYNILNI